MKFANLTLVKSETYTVGTDSYDPGAFEKRTRNTVLYNEVITVNLDQIVSMKALSSELSEEDLMGHATFDKYPTKICLSDQSDILVAESIHYITSL